jgi:hypothetical protein
MKIGGGNYEEEDVAEAKKVTREVIFQKIEPGKVMNEGKMYEPKSIQEPARVQGKTYPEEGRNAPDAAAAPALAPAPEPTNPCDATAHKWSEPTTAPITIQRTSVICKNCALVLTTEKQGTPGEVMADLLRQIPH